MNILDRISFYCFLGALFLLPIFYLPGTMLSVNVAKGFFFSIAITVSLALWLVARLVEGKVSVPKSALLGFGFLFSLAVLASALFSPTVGLSIFGSGFEAGTFANIAVLFFSMFLASIFFSDKKNIRMVFPALTGSFILVSVFVILNLIAGPSSALAKALPIGIVGSFNDLAIFSCLVIILSLLSIELMPLTRTWKIVNAVLAAVAFFFLALVNFYWAWIILGVISLFIFIFSFISSSSATAKKKRFPAASFVGVIIALVFILGGSFIGGLLPGRLHIDNTEVRPSLSATLSIDRQVLAKSPVLGTSPDRFSQAWALYKPKEVSQTPFWDANFSYGSGLVPTLAATTGILGIIFLLAFFVSFLIQGFSKAASPEAGDPLMLAVFLSAIMLWSFTFIYVPNIVSLALAFSFTGAMIALMPKKQAFSFSFIKDPRLSFFSILVLVALIAGTVSSGFYIAKKFAGIVYFQKSASLPNTAEGIAQAEALMLKAVSLDKSNDLYFRALSQAYSMDLGNVLNQNAAPSDDLKAKIQLLLSQSEASAKQAVAIDPANSENWLALSAVYEGIVPLGVQGAYDSAKAALGKALALNPYNPGIYLRMARLEASAKNLSGAQADLEAALELRPGDQDLTGYLEQIKAAQAAPAPAPAPETAKKK